MRLSSSVLLVIGAVLLLTRCREIQSFTIGRNITIFIDDVDSQETATDDPIDSMEHAQNQTSVEDVHNDSLENKDRLIKSNIHFVEGLNQTEVQISTGDFSLEDHSVDSNDRIQTVDVNHDDLHDTHSTEDIVTIHHQENQSAEHVFNQFQLHLLEVQDELVKRNAPIADANVQSATEGQLLAKHFDIQDDFWEDQLARLIVPLAADVGQLQTSTPDVIPPSPVSIFDNQPIVGIFSHPASDDLYLVKKYLGDYYFWEVEHKLVRDSFLQPVRDVIKLDSDSPIKVDAVHFAQFTPVRSLWDDRQQATSIAV